MSVTNKFSLPLLVILWLGVCLFLIGYTYVLYDRYTEEFHHAKETLVNSKRFYDGVCQNATNREIYHSVDSGTDQKCHDIEHVLNKDPRQIALSKTLANALGICIDQTCTSVMSDIKFLLELVIILVVLVLIAVAMCGFQLTRYSKQKIAETELPTGNSKKIN